MTNEELQAAIHEVILALSNDMGGGSYDILFTHLKALLAAQEALLP